MEPDSQLDINKITAHVIDAQITSLFRSIPASVIKKHKEFKARTGLLLRGYLQSVGQHLYNVKTLLHEDAGVPITQIYEPLDFEHCGTRLESPTIFEIFELSRCMILTGTAGSGKSTAFRYFFLTTLQAGEEIPILLPLRELNNSELSLSEHICQHIAKYAESEMTPTDLDILLDSVPVALFLDGLDEVNDESRDHVMRAILDIATRFTSTRVLISSRPTDVTPWENFLAITLQPLSQPKAQALVSRVAFDPEIKKKFLKLLDGSLYRTHTSFSSNPLLLTLMLLMFSRNAEIPNKWHLFYDQAFEMLFHRHDAKKPGGYKRVYRTGLAIDDFQRAFSALASLCYDGNILSFSPAALRALAEDASSLSGVQYEADAFIEDLEKQVCLIIMDGLEYRFTHKTFVEHFAAIFISGIEDKELQKQVLVSLGARARTEGFIISLFARAREACFECVIDPWCTEVLGVLGAESFEDVAAYEAFLELAKPVVVIRRVFPGTQRQPSFMVRSNPIWALRGVLVAIGFPPPVMPESEAREIYALAGKVHKEMALAKLDASHKPGLGKGDHEYPLAVLRGRNRRLDELVDRNSWVGREALLFIGRVREKLMKDRNTRNGAMKTLLLQARRQ